MVKRYAFTLVELIFAIIVIALVVISLPMMNQATSNGISSGIVQEAIFASSTKLNEALSALWDDNSTEPGSPYGLARVIDINQECVNDPTDPYYRRKKGHILEMYHRRCLDSNITQPSNSSSNNDVTSLDDMVATDVDLFLNMTPSDSGYKNEYIYTLDVTNASVAFPSTSASNLNIKKVQVYVKDKSTSKLLVSLKAYSFNIGEVDVYSKVMQ